MDVEEDRAPVELILAVPGNAASRDVSYTRHRLQIDSNSEG
jgi:hypothetical protein